MKKFIIAACVGIMFAACGSKQETKTVEEQALAYAEQMEQAIQAGDTATVKSRAEEMTAWNESLSADDQLKVLSVVDIDEVVAKAESTLNVSLTDAAKQAAEEVVDAAATAAEGVADQAKAAAEEAVNSAKEQGKAAVDAAKEAGKAAINDAAKKGADAVNAAAQKGAEAIKQAADQSSKKLGL